jgi:hypothetical protein
MHVETYVPMLILKVSAGHAMHLPVAVSELPVSCCPGGQGFSGIHRVVNVPLMALKVPAGHFVHDPGMLSEFE